MASPSLSVKTQKRAETSHFPARERQGFERQAARLYLARQLTDPFSAIWRGFLERLWASHKRRTLLGGKGRVSAGLLNRG